MSQPKDFGFSEDEQMLRDAARRFLDESAGVEAIRKLVASDWDEAYESDVQPARWDENAWRKMVELGWTALAVPEAAGGLGMSFVAVAALAEEVGRHAAPGPLLATIEATVVLRECGTDAAASALGKIAEGAPATLAITNAAGSWDPADTDVEAKADGDGYVLDGTASFVQDARKASLFVVSARAKDGLGLFVVPADAPGVDVAPDQIVDLTRDQATVRFEGVKVAADGVAAAPGRGEEALGKATPGLLTIVAADMAGAGEWQLQTTTEYAKVRKQFDRPLGFFQAVKHPIVDMMVAVDAAKSLVYNAACAIDAEPEEAERFARMAKASASDAAAYCSGRSVQLHGGIGFTWECDVHIWFKRQKHNQQLFGDGTYQRQKLADLY